MCVSVFPTDSNAEEEVPAQSDVRLSGVVPKRQRLKNLHFYATEILI